MNLDLLKDQGYSVADLKDVGAADLIIALDCDTEQTYEACMKAAGDTLAGKKKKKVLNMVARASKEARSISVDLAKEPTSNLQSLFIETKKGAD